MCMTHNTGELIGAVVTAVAIAGVLLNNRRRRECFALWAFSNALSALLHVTNQMWALAVRDSVFLVLAADGWVRWGRNA